MTDDERRRAWQQAAAIARAGEWARWPGLPPGLTATEALAELTGATTTPPPVASTLGRRTRERVDAPPLHIWTDGPSVILVEWRDPPSATTMPELIAALGAPDREGAGRHLRSGATTTERVYAARGLALTVAESYDQPPGFAPFAATVQLFAPGTLRDFVLELGGDDQPGPRVIDPRGR